MSHRRRSVVYRGSAAPLRGVARARGGPVAHVTLIERPAGRVAKLAFRYARHRFGQVVEPVAAAAHHAGVLICHGGPGNGRRAGVAAPRSSPALAGHPARGGPRSGCSWCTDYGYYEGMQLGIDPRKVRDVPRFRESDVYDEVEKAVLDVRGQRHGPRTIGGVGRDRRRAEAVLERARDRGVRRLGGAQELEFEVQRRSGPENRGAAWAGSSSPPSL